MGSALWQLVLGGWVEGGWQLGGPVRGGQVMPLPSPLSCPSPPVPVPACPTAAGLHKSIAALQPAPQPLPSPCMVVDSSSPEELGETPVQLPTRAPTEREVDEMHVLGGAGGGRAGRPPVEKRLFTSFDGVCVWWGAVGEGAVCKVCVCVCVTVFAYVSCACVTVCVRVWVFVRVGAATSSTLP